MSERKAWIIPFLFVIAVIAIIWVCILDAKEMEKQHCKSNGNTRETMHWNYIYDSKGNIQSMYPVWNTEYQYTCDDYPRWR